MKHLVDKNICIGCGLCVSMVPENFKLDENFKAEAIGTVTDEQKCIESKDACPVMAISVEN